MGSKLFWGRLHTTPGLLVLCHMRTQCPNTLQSKGWQGTILQTERKQANMADLAPPSTQHCRKQISIYKSWRLVTGVQTDYTIPSEPCSGPYDPQNLEVYLYLEIGSFQMWQGQGHMWTLNLIQLASLYEMRKTDSQAENNHVALETQTVMVPRALDARSRKKKNQRRS